MTRLQGPAAERGWTSLAHKYIDEQHVLGALNDGAFVYFDTSTGEWTARAVSPTEHYSHLEMKEAIENFTLARLFYAKGKDGGTDFYPDGIESGIVGTDPTDDLTRRIAHRDHWRDWAATAAASTHANADAMGLYAADSWARMNVMALQRDQNSGPFAVAKLTGNMACTPNQFFANVADYYDVYRASVAIYADQHGLDAFWRRGFVFWAPSNTTKFVRDAASPEPSDNFEGTAVRAGDLRTGTHTVLIPETEIDRSAGLGLAHPFGFTQPWLTQDRWVGADGTGGRVGRELGA